MTFPTVPAQIVGAIKAQDGALLTQLFAAHPDQIMFVTPFGAQTWLGYAAAVGKLESAQALVAIGLSVNVGDHRDNTLPICRAASSGHEHVVAYLLEAGSNLDTSASIRNPLSSAIVGRSAAITTMLLDAGIDSTVRYNTSTMKNMDAMTFALMRGERECALVIALRHAHGDTNAAHLALADATMIATRNSGRN